MPGLPLPPDTTKLLNLLRESPTFVLLEDDAGEAAVSAPAAIPGDSGLWWVGAVLRTPAAGIYDAVLVVDTGAGGELCGGYVWDGEWICLDDLVNHVGASSRSDVYPFNYSLKVPLESNHFG